MCIDIFIFILFYGMTRYFSNLMLLLMILFSTCCAAMEALNLYEPWTYEEQVDVDAYTDPTELQAVLDQMAFMGQTPWQLLTSPHPQRHPIGGKFVLEHFTN